MSSEVTRDWGLEEGMTTIWATSPARLYTTGMTVATSGTLRKVVSSAVITERSAPLATLPTTTRGPLTPGPKPWANKS